MVREYMVRRTSIKRQPTHPGALLAADIFPALRLNVTQAAERLRVSRQTLHRIISGRTAITPEMAVRLGKLCGNGPGLWLRMQQAYDLWQAQKRLKSELAKIPAVHATT
ncbi:MAG: HigA family addiction module antidote protein [Acidobacteriota bacterium]|nr:HigA family addiction module antidote protein [Acidobacteriota bacterium]